MTLQLIKFWLLISLSLIFTSCYRPLFQPEAIHDPMLYAKGQKNINASIGVTDAPFAPLSYNFGIAYSPIKSLGLKAAIRGRDNFGGNLKTNDDGSTYYSNHANGLSIETGAGYYVSLSDMNFFTIYGNYMYGKNSFESYQKVTKHIDDRVSNNYTAFSLQPSFLFVRKYMNIGLGFRFSAYKFESIKVENSAYTSYNSYLLQEGKWHPILEPFFNMEVGKGKIRFTSHLGPSFCPSEVSANNGNTFVNFSLGLNVRL